MSSTDRRSVRANVDAVVIGVGHHGLVAAALLAAPDGTCSCSRRSPNRAERCAALN
jgi:hypothetical protein